MASIHLRRPLILLQTFIILSFGGCSESAKPDGDLLEEDAEVASTNSHGDNDLHREFTTMSVANVSTDLDSASIKQSLGDSMPAGDFTEQTITEKYSADQIKCEYDVRNYASRQIRHGKYQEFYPSGTLFCNGAYANNRRDGAWVFYHADGLVAREAEYDRGSPTGTWRRYRSDGTCEQTLNYEAGKKNGTQSTYWADGKTVKMEEQYVGNQRHGVVFRYDKAGNKIHEMCFRDGLPNGKEYRWYSSGQLSVEGNYSNGHPHGIFVYYDAEGTKTTEVKWTEGRRAPSGALSVSP